MKRSAISLFILIAVVLGMSCRGPMGPRGATGPTLYLKDSTGARYYSGSSIFLGVAPDIDFVRTPVSKTLSLVNATDGAISLVGGSSAQRAVPISGGWDSSYIVNPGASPTISVGVGNYELYSDGSGPVLLTLSQGTAPLDSIPAGGSTDFVATLTGAYAQGGLFRRTYEIEAEDKSGAEDDFIFEVYGFAAC
jgi:hypothetical protein